MVKNSLEDRSTSKSDPSGQPFYFSILEIWRKEQQSVLLEPLPPDFYYSSLGKVMQLKEETERRINGILEDKILARVLQLIQDLQKLRRQKIIENLLNQRPISTKNLTTDERELYEAIVISFNLNCNLFQNMYQLQKQPHPKHIEPAFSEGFRTQQNESDKRRNDEEKAQTDQAPIQQVNSKESLRKFVVVRIKRPLIEFIGTDDQFYGPFESEDIARLPLENIRKGQLIEKGYCEEIDVSEEI